MFDLSVAADFSSAHFLRNYNGPCENLHGHTWKVEIVISSPTLNEIGLVVDFREVKEKFHAFLNTLDHVCLNDLPYFKENNPSTENLARYIYEAFLGPDGPYRVKQVRVWESDSCSVTYSPDS